MVTYPIPDNETSRLEALAKYNVLDTLAEPDFDDIVKLAAHICGVPIALVSLVDKNRQWFKSKLGLDKEETPREIAFCAHAIMQKGLFIVQDALQDDRFATNPLVISDPSVRFYAGCTLSTSEGYNLGTLCVIDRIPRKLSLEQYDALECLSKQVMAQLELRAYSKVLETTLDVLKKAEARNHAFLSAIPDSMYIINSEGYVIDLKMRRESELALFKRDIISKNINQILPDDLAIKTKELVDKAIGNQQVELYEYKYEVLGKLRDYESRVVKSGEDEALAIVRDVTERKDAERASAKLMEEVILKNAELASKNEELIKSHKENNLIFSAFSDLLPGTVLDGKYLLESKIGIGGYGVVYRAKHLSLNRPVAVKIFRPSVGNDSIESLERFKLEGILACQLEHANAVSILDSGISEGKIVYLVMELLEGYTLRTLLNENKVLSPKRSIEILLPICDVLSHAHQKGIVHRDIKPDNIFLHQTPKGEIVKLVDFGIAKSLFESANNLQGRVTTQGIIGTPNYLAPERLTNLPYDGKSDVYSLGILSYEMMSGFLPFQISDPTNFMEVAMAHIKSEPLPFKKIAPTVPKEAEVLLNKTLAKKPDIRPTAAELFQKLSLIKDEFIEDNCLFSYQEISDNQTISNSTITIADLNIEKFRGEDTR